MPRWVQKEGGWEDGRDRYLFTDFELGIIALIWFVAGLTIGVTFVWLVH